MFLWVARAALFAPILVAHALAQQPMPVDSFTPSGLQLRQQMSLASPAYRRLLPSLATVVVRGQSPGRAVLIDSSGLYLATKMLGVSGEVELNFSNGHIGHATIISEDTCTQLVLLRSDYVPAGSVPMTPAQETPPGTPLLVVLDRGAVTARIASDTRLGQVKPSNRLVPLSEIWLELPSANIGGAPVFTAYGKFVGLLSASLIHSEGASQTAGGLGGAANQFKLGENRATFSSVRHKPKMGPGNLVVVYLPAPDVMRLVFEGFGSANHAVDHPSLGIFCRDGAGGALVQEVVGDSAADRIGIREGDLIQAIGGYEVRSKSDFAKVMFKVRSGEKVVIRFDHDGHTIVRETVLGQSPD